jgi:hypothetical protein
MKQIEGRTKQIEIEILLVMKDIKQIKKETEQL